MRSRTTSISAVHCTEHMCEGPCFDNVREVHREVVVWDVKEGCDGYCWVACGYPGEVCVVWWGEGTKALSTSQIVNIGSTWRTGD